jgi:ABC-type multidrug transport system fused ATPase/permease subunit
MASEESGRLMGGIESANEVVDRIAAHFPAENSERIREMSAESELKLLKLFPYCVVLAAITWIGVMVYHGEYTFGYAIMDLGLVFIALFSLIGLVCLPFVHKGPFPFVLVVAAAFVVSLLQWCIGHVLDIMVYTEAVDKILLAIGIDLSHPAIDIATFVAIFCVTILSSYGVLFVTVSYLRKDLAKVFINMEKNARRGVRGKSEKFFQVPDIIDVKEVIVEPEIDVHKFNLRVMARISYYNVILGLIVSSYLFINPLFLEMLDSSLMVSVMLLLSMFMPILVIIWVSVQVVGAKVVSDAPRPYYLWKGAKNKLWGSFIALGAFAVMIWLSLYYGHSILDIIYSYLMFLIPLILITAIYSFMFVNNFMDPLKVSVLKRFLEGKELL